MCALLYCHALCQFKNPLCFKSVIGIFVKDDISLTSFSYIFTTRNILDNGMVSPLECIILDSKRHDLGQTVLACQGYNAVLYIRKSNCT